MDLEDLKMIMTTVADCMKEYVGQQLSPIIERLDVLEAHSGLKALPKPRIRVAAGKGKRS